MKLETLPPSQHATRSSRRWRKPVAILVVLAAAGGGWSVMQNKAAPPATAAAKDKAPEVLELAGTDITAVDARALDVKLPLSGSLAPLSSATIKSKVSGVVEATTVQEGMSVTAGQVLARIDQADLRARLQQQQAALDEAQAKLSLASKNENNSQALLKQKFISQTAYDATQNSVDLARANVKSAAAMVEIARIALNDGVIRAPISGVISKRHVQAGEKLAPDMPVFSIVNLSELTLEAQVPAAEIPRVKIGQEVKFKVDGFQGRDFAGKVSRINPATEAGSRAMLVYIAVRNEDSALRAGMFAKGSIVTDRSAVAPIIPLTALRGDQNQPVVYQIVAGKVVAQPVKLGLRNEDEGLVEVRAGLQAGANVIVARLDAVKPGTQVKLPAAAQDSSRQASAAAGQKG
ncbi:efflux RND transporter periplasmic adaptor subunit [Duganella qianjiadongensis]|uniref:Efflux RND transporter periplasmic adaptor subunit n=1 Tax=Duganella qianjiadongensis TaxID=2692176 RepID=A0ABW9VJB9_9BURK|nr:efflux RND transporter periplasmic adaptor subunit [Duganella qianjiadongensis]MYM38755.1 efflux RND transporter periplasmic adaptor subunit [Duganella qianjiadongensis]